jgi:tetratricopeptide (TPR) repeat protein
MTNTSLSISAENDILESFEDRIDILFHELELATKWQRPSVILAVYSSEYVRADATIALENHLQALGQSTHHIKIKDQESADVSLKISELSSLANVVFFVEGLRWGRGQNNHYIYDVLNERKEFFIENRVRVVFWLTEKEAVDMAHYAPDYWTFRHRVIEFVDSPKPDRLSPCILESAWQGMIEFSNTNNDLDAKIALRAALLNNLPTGNESTSARANLLLTLGMLHWRRGDYERAAQFLNAALELAARLEDNGFEALCFNAIALVQTEWGQMEEAIQSYQNAITLAPEQITPWNNLGHLFRKLERLPEALEAFQKAVEKNASDALGWNGLGDVYHKTGKIDDAIYSYLKAIEISPEYPHSWCGLGNSYLDVGQIDEALAAHQKAIELDNHTINSWLGLGSVFTLQGSTINAEKAYRNALELDPKNPRAWNELGNILFNAGTYEDALLSYQKGMEFNQGGYLSYSNIASIQMMKGNHKEAIPLLHKAIEQSCNNKETARLLNLVGDTYRRLDDYENALVAYRKADEIDPENTRHQSESPKIESTEPALVSLSEDSPATGEAEIESKNEEPVVMSWLDGLASVMPVFPRDKSELAEPEITDQPDLADGPGEYLATSVQTIKFEQVEEGSEPVLISDSCEIIMDDVKEPSLSDDTQETYLDDEVQPSLAIASQESTTKAEAEPILANDHQESNPEEEAKPVLAQEQPEAILEEKPVVMENPANKYNNAADINNNQVTIAEKNAQIWNELGNVYYNTGAFVEAIHAFEMAIELDPSCGWSYNNLASIYLHQKHYADAIPLYQQGLQLLSDSRDKALLWNRLGDAYRRLNQHGQATAAYQKAIELDPENVSLLTRARFSLLGNLRA